MSVSTAEAASMKSELCDAQTIVLLCDGIMSNTISMTLPNDTYLHNNINHGVDHCKWCHVTHVHVAMPLGFWQ